MTTVTATTLAARRAGLLRLFRHKALDLDERIAAGQVDTTLLVDFDHFHNDLVADGHNVLNGLHAADIEFADVHKALFTRRNLHKRAERHKTGHAAFVNRTDFGVFGNRLNDRQRAAGIVGVLLVCIGYLFTLGLFANTKA